MADGQKSGPSEDEYQGQISSTITTAVARQLGREVARQLSGSGSVEVASFEEVVQTLKKVEETQDTWATAGDCCRLDREVDGETTTPLTLLKRLNAYRKQCESNGEYVEAQKARKKYEELRAKELGRVSAIDHRAHNL
eukprot:Skav228820  [mRNA]  locus=scaffold359:450957:453505:+ [translate_table: standard]